MIYHILLDVGLFQPRRAAVPSQDPLIERAANGDRAAFVTLYRAHYAEVRRFAERLLGSALAADDLVHEVFLALPAALARFRGQSSLRSYILSITVRSARRHLRAAARRRAIEAKAAQALGASSRRPDADSERHELAAWLTRALDELPLEQRAAFVLCEVEERSSVEAGEILREKPGTVRARVFHAKRKLRERLAELAPETRVPALEVES